MLRRVYPDCVIRAPLEVDAPQRPATRGGPGSSGWPKTGNSSRHLERNRNRGGLLLAFHQATRRVPCQLGHRAVLERLLALRRHLLGKPIAVQAPERVTVAWRNSSQSRKAATKPIDS